jgi:uracil-DNA glycosylase
MEYLNLSTSEYKYKSWNETKEINILSYVKEINWYMLFSSSLFKKDIKNIESELEKIKKENQNIYPYPELMFSIFNIVPMSLIKVVIIGQDPYFNSKYNLPQAMGLSFSVPKGFKIPPSLSNIYKNLLENKNIVNKPTHGNLTFWALQGVFLLNTILTVFHGKQNSHKKIWSKFIDKVIKYISDNCNNVIFVLWGKPASTKNVLINTKKHKILYASHPSGQSCHSTINVYENKKIITYPSFNDSNHFTYINNYLKKHKKTEIIWEIPT